MSDAQITTVTQTLVAVYIPGDDGPETSTTELAILRDDGHLTVEPIVIIDDDAKTV